MGLFGRKKAKKAAKADPPPSEDPPTTEVASPDDEVVVENVDLSEETPYVAHKNSDEEVPKSAALGDRVTATWASVLALWFGLSKTTQVAVAAGAAVGAIGVIALVAAGGRAPAFPAHINVAWVGSSYIYVNDLPRVVEQMGGGLGGHITQDSVIHNEANILQILMAGNGMYNKWATRSAMDRGVAFDTSDGTTAYLYDMGSCSVPQLLTGSDPSVTSGNQLGAFLDDGQNPCFQDDAYLQYQEQKGLNHGWDYLVISDLSKNMVFTDTRELALMAFNYTYAPLLKKKNVSPIIVQPHAFATYGSSGSQLQDIVTFTENIMEGAEIYKNYLNKRIGLFAHAHIAPVGNAFLAVYDESPSDIWPKLFLDDNVHPSAYGTFLYGCVIYATMTGHMPPYKRVVVDDMENSMVFATARRLQASSSQVGFPTKDEADFLFKIAKKVALRGYKPKMVSASTDATYLRNSNSGNNQNDNVYYGEYSDGQDYVGDDASVYSYMYEAQDSENGNYDYENYENQGYEDEEYEYAEDEEQEEYDEDEEQEYDEEEEAEDADYDDADYEEAAEDAAEEEAEDSSQGNDNSYHEAADEYFSNYGQNKNNNQQQEFEEHDTQYYYSNLQSANEGD